jgi:hypothetical protein
MVEDELIEDSETLGADLHTSEGANDPWGEGWEVEDMVVDDADEGKPATNPDDVEGLKEAKTNASEEHARTRTSITPTMADFLTVRVSSSNIGAFSTEKLAILK